jgi:high mobility group protein B3
MSIPQFGNKKPVGTRNPVLSKKLKDSQAPKRPISSFIAFSMTERAKIKEDLGTQSMAEVGKELGRRWGGLDAESKAVCDLASKQAKERFDEEMKSYRPSEEFLKKKAEMEAKKSCSVAERPGVGVGARTVEAYFAFLFSSWRQELSDRPTQSAQDIQDLVWQRWNSTDTTDQQSAPDSVSRGKKPRKVRDPLAPKKPLSSYFLYMDSIRAEVVSSLPQLSHREVMVELGKRWSGLDEAARAPFLVRAQKLKVEYVVAVEKYRSNKLGDQMEEASERREGMENLVMEEDGSPEMEERVNDQS